MFLQLRSLLYPVVGLNATTGEPMDCSAAGKVTLRAQEVPVVVAAAAAGDYLLSAAGANGMPRDLPLDPNR